MDAGFLYPDTRCQIGITKCIETPLLDDVFGRIEQAIDSLLCHLGNSSCLHILVLARSLRQCDSAHCHP